MSCWGIGMWGRLGYGNTTDIGDNETPASAGTVALPGNEAAVAISAHTFGTCVVLASGKAACWGYNLLGQLGYGNTDNIGDNETPASVGTIALPGGQDVEHQEVLVEDHDVDGGGAELARQPLGGDACAHLLLVMG